MIEDEMANIIEHTKARILHSLQVFPFLAASQLHQSIGSATSTKLWRPLLEELIEDGKIVVTHIQEVTPSGRTQSYTIYHLAANPYIYGTGIGIGTGTEVVNDGTGTN